MPRTPRVDTPGALHHVVAKGSAGEWIVRDDLDRQSLLIRVANAVHTHRWTCLAYCVLDTHVHLVVGTPGGNLGRGMQQLLARHAREFNARHKREGNLFHTRFFSKHVDTNEHLVSAIVYVLLNPVRAGVAKEPEHWPWSSYPATMGLAEAPSFLACDAALELVDSDPVTARLRLKLALSEARQRDFDSLGVRHRV